jgi:predicted Zn-dependent protease
MEDFFKNIGKKAGQSFRRGKWLYKSVLGSEEEAIQAEYYVGKEIFAKLIEQSLVDANQEVITFLNEIGSLLASQLNNKYRKFSFRSIISQDINAFALPGGFIFTTSSILKTFNYSRDEIAFILGHEIGHVVKWHIFNKTVASSSLNFLAMVTKPNGLVGSVAVRAINSLMQNSYSRDQELEADEFGATLMYAAGFNPSASIKVLDKLGKAITKDSNFFNYFSTHPTAEIRIRKIETLINKKFN